jgi:hypothetical protein
MIGTFILLAMFAWLFSIAVKLIAKSVLLAYMSRTMCVTVSLAGITSRAPTSQLGPCDTVRSTVPKALDQPLRLVR